MGKAIYTKAMQKKMSFLIEIINLNKLHRKWATKMPLNCTMTGKLAYMSSENEDSNSHCKYQQDKYRPALSVPKVLAQPLAPLIYLPMSHMGSTGQALISALKSDYLWQKNIMITWTEVRAKCLQGSRL